MTAPKVTYIHAGQLLDRPGARPRGNSTIVVRGGLIAEVRDGFVPAPAGAETVDLKDHFVLPGLTDLHVHLWGIGGDPMRERLLALTRDDADDQMQAIVNARTTLRAGFTTVRDLGGNPRGIRALRDAIERGEMAPTIVNAGRMISITGGSGDGTNGLAEELANAVHAHQINTCDGPDDCRRATRAQIGLGAQVIKFAATGGVLSNVAGGLGRAMTPEEMKAIVDTAHSFGRKAAAHSHATEGTGKTSLEAGVDTVEHATFLDDKTMTSCSRRRARTSSPRKSPRSPRWRRRAPARCRPRRSPRRRPPPRRCARSHRKAYRAGVKFAFGTDTGVSKHGDNATEFAELVKDGMSASQAIASATTVAAEALGRDDIGTIAPGKRADVIAVTGSPLDDVTRLEKVDFVMHRGVVAKRVAD
ncbi:amidohydrolase family protein [Sphingomonas sp. MMS24-JH45]